MLILRNVEAAYWGALMLLTQYYNLKHWDIPVTDLRSV